MVVVVVGAVRPVVVVIHPGPRNMPVVDIFVKKNARVRRRIIELLGEQEIPITCPYAQAFVEAFPEYEHVASLDFEHIPDINAGVLEELLLIGAYKPAVITFTSDVPPRIVRIGDNWDDLPEDVAPGVYVFSDDEYVVLDEPLDKDALKTIISYNQMK